MNTKDCTIGFLIGIGAGLAIGLLWAPQSGTEARGFLAARTQDGVDRVRGTANDLANSASAFVETSRAEVVRQQEGLRNAVEAGKKAYQQTAG